MRASVVREQQFARVDSMHRHGGLVGDRVTCKNFCRGAKTSVGLVRDDSAPRIIDYCSRPCLVSSSHFGCFCSGAGGLLSPSWTCGLLLGGAARLCCLVPRGAPMSRNDSSFGVTGFRRLRPFRLRHVVGSAAAGLQPAVVACL